MDEKTRAEKIQKLAAVLKETGMAGSLEVAMKMAEDMVGREAGSTRDQTMNAKPSQNISVDDEQVKSRVSDIMRGKRKF